MPRLLVQGVQFDNARYRNRKDSRGNKIRYPYTTFTLSDRTGSIAGIWWGHASYELPKGLADVVVELDYMSARRDRPKATFDYQVRLIDVRPHEPSPPTTAKGHHITDRFTRMCPRHHS